VSSRKGKQFSFWTKNVRTKIEPVLTPKTDFSQSEEILSSFNAKCVGSCIFQIVMILSR